MIKIKIYGKLAKDLGFSVKEADCLSSGDVFRFLDSATYGNFTRKLLEFKKELCPYAVFLVRDGGLKAVDSNDHRLQCGDEFICIPVTSLSGAEVAFTLLGAKITYGMLAGIAINLALSAAFALLSMLLAPAPPQISGGGPEAKRKEAYLFDGRARTINQGSCVPVGYGRMLVPGSVIYNRVEYIRI